MLRERDLNTMETTRRGFVKVASVVGTGLALGRRGVLSRRRRR